MKSNARAEEITLLDLVLAVQEAADSPREARAALAHLFATKQVRFERRAAARLVALGSAD